MAEDVRQTLDTVAELNSLQLMVAIARAPYYVLDHKKLNTELGVLSTVPITSGSAEAILWRTEQLAAVEHLWKLCRADTDTGGMERRHHPEADAGLIGAAHRKRRAPSSLLRNNWSSLTSSAWSEQFVETAGGAECDGPWFNRTSEPHVGYISSHCVYLLCELKSPSVSDFLWGLENSGWLKHIKAIIDAGIFIAKAVAEEGVSVLVHCSDGWDRTAQVCSVASLLLDPFYRTIKGFMVLIEKDWVSFGHKFNHRYGYLNGDPKEISPVIDQFIECIWQLMEQFPCAFEFNERFLIHIQHHIYSCQFGNFLCNSQKERQELKIQERTYSLWAHLWKNRANYMNPLYREDHNQTQGTLHPQTASCNFLYKFWSGMYTRFEKGMHPGQSVTDYLMAVKEETQQLEEELEVLEQRLANLKKVQLNNRKENYKQQDHNTHLGLSTSNNSIANTPQDYINNVKSFPSRSPSQGDEEDSALILTQDNLKSSDPDLSANSDQESGVEDLGCRSPSGGCCLPTEDSGKDSDEAVFHAV
nr:myotubularin-related protein 7-like [Chelonoidis abingdonii]